MEKAAGALSIVQTHSGNEESGSWDESIATRTGTALVTNEFAIAQKETRDAKEVHQ